MAITKITTPELFDLSTVNTALRLPNGSTATRPASASQGEWRFNTDLKYVEFYDGNNWRQIDTEATCTTNTVDYPTTNTAYYKLDSSAVDQTTNNYDGTSTDITYYNGQQYSQGAVFNGSSSFISASNAPSDILDTSAAFSYSLWIKPNTISLYDWVIGIQQAASPYAGVGLFGNNSNTLGIALAGAGPQAMTPTLTLNTWSHIVLTHDGSGTYTCYTNNNGSPITYSGATSNNSANPFRLGFSSVSGWGYYDGSIDQVRIFSSELTASQVTELYKEVQCPCTTDDNNNPTTNVAYYKLDGNANDSTTSANNGTWSGTEAYEYGPYGIAGSFNGTNSKITKANLFDGTQVTMSASIWAKATDWTPSTNESILDIGDNSTSLAQNRIFINSSTTDIIVSIDGGDGGFASASQSFTNNTWHHIVGTWDVTGGAVTNGIKIYLDGVLAAQGNSTTGFSSAKNLALGVNENQSVGDRLFWNGCLDQVRIFNTVLTPTQVTSLYDEVYCNTVSKLDIFNEGTSSCLALYEFEDNADSTDSSTYDGLWSGTEAYGGGQYKKGGVFNGASVISLPQPTLSGAFSFSIWINTTVGTLQNIIGMGGSLGVASAGLNLYTFANKVYSSWGNGTTEDSFTTQPSTIINTGDWFHIVLTTSGLTNPTVKAYINGTLAATEPSTQTINTTTYASDFSIGAQNFTTTGAATSYHYTGKLDQFRIFNKELTATEVLQVYTE
jgi:hypothetical protein